jgi:spore coat polysaccharide biosynthesis protein SpsF (cytidylyltransferase family)
MQNRIGIIVQARTGSTRLPGKVLLPFYEDKSILDIIIERLKTTELPLVVATSVSLGDNEIIKCCRSNSAEYFRGSENDVLLRFIGAANKFNIDTIVRICADNPFIQADSILALIKEYDRLNQAPHYLSFRFKDNTPSILTHFGFYGELVTLKALKDAAARTADQIYHEHVTNYLYKNKDIYKVEFLDAPVEIYNREDIRLTIDSIEDFRNAQYLYKKVKNDLSIKNILENLKEEPELVKNMINQLIKYKK